MAPAANDQVENPSLFPSVYAAAVAAVQQEQNKASQTKKRPYRRTRRPDNYCDKSTITTTTDSISHINVYDAVLAESEDLLTAASEAQQLGRLKMSSAYLLLLHARLVGLGKRFDKAERPHSVEATTANHSHEPPVEQVDSTPRKPSSSANTRDSPEAAALALSSPLPAATRAVQQQHVALLEEPTPKTAAAKQLASMLPSNIEMDQAMMEHLAKAAAELHAARCGRKRDSILQSPDAREFLANTANQKGVPNAANTGIAWSLKELTQLHRAAAAGKGPKEIAIVVGRSEQQVRAYMRNEDVKARVEADLELPADETPRKKGRGRKPATAAMNTVPDAICNARDLLKGNILKESKD